MTMPIGSTEEPDVEVTDIRSIPVHVVSSDAKPGKAIGTEFARWRTFLVNNQIGQDSATPGARRLLNRSLRRHRALIKVNASVTPAVGGSVTAVAAFAAAGNGTATLAAGASITGFDVTFGQAASANIVTVTVTGASGGTLTYTVTIEGTGSATPALSIRFPQPLTPANPAVGIAVTVTGNVNSPAGNITAFGQSASVAAQSLTDGVIIGSREEICSGQPMTPGNIGGYLQIGDSYRIETQAEMWVAYPVTNSAPVYVTVCDEVYASDPDSHRSAS